MLVKTIAQQFPGRVRVQEENFGESALAERFGVKRYPAVFVNEVLVAKPKDFGFFGKSGSQGAGRYTPWLKPENQMRFREDMGRIVKQALRGELSASAATGAPEEESLRQLPKFLLKDLAGVEVNSSALEETVTIVEFWATWCPPCIKALPWLSELQAQHPTQLQILGVAIESPLGDLRAINERFELPFPVVQGTAELAIDFGDLVAVPTTFVFGVGGKLIQVFHGAPPTLKQDIEALLEVLGVDKR